MNITLVPIENNEYDDLRYMLLDYYSEIADYEIDIENSEDLRDRSFAAMLNDMEGRELIWIEANSERAGFIIVRSLADWPHEERMIASIAEFFVDPAYRRRGIGSQAVEILLANHRNRGTYLVEADILHLNEPAKAFWYGLGFELQFLQTGRKP